MGGGGLPHFIGPISFSQKLKRPLRAVFLCKCGHKKLESLMQKSQQKFVVANDHFWE